MHIAQSRDALTEWLISCIANRPDYNYDLPHRLEQLSTRIVSSVLPQYLSIRYYYKEINRQKCVLGVSLCPELVNFILLKNKNKFFKRFYQFHWPVSRNVLHIGIDYTSIVLLLQWAYTLCPEIGGTKRKLINFYCIYRRFCAKTFFQEIESEI